MTKIKTNMNTKHVTSLETSKQLAEAGIVIESEFWWVEDNPEDWVLVPKGWTNIEMSRPKKYPAPIATEILERLPAMLNGLKFQINRLPKGEYWVSYDTFSNEVVDSYLETNQSLPDALALLLIRLTKDGLT